MSYKRLSDGRYTSVRCDDCGIPLSPVHEDTVDEIGTWKNLQADRALWLVLEGGYGEFLDPLGDNPRFVLCVECAVTLVNSNPWMKSALSTINGSVGHHCKAERDRLVFSAYWNCPVCRPGEVLPIQGEILSPEKGEA